VQDDEISKLKTSVEEGENKIAFEMKKKVGLFLI